MPLDEDVIADNVRDDTELLFHDPKQPQANAQHPPVAQPKDHGVEDGKARAWAPRDHFLEHVPGSADLPAAE